MFKCVGDEEEEGLLSDLPTEIHIQYILIVIEDTELLSSLGVKELNRQRSIIHKPNVSSVFPVSAAPKCSS